MVKKARVGVNNLRSAFVDNREGLRHIGLFIVDV